MSPSLMMDSEALNVQADDERLRCRRQASGLKFEVNTEVATSLSIGNEVVYSLYIASYV
jgi:hypothetical protein